MEGKQEILDALNTLTQRVDKGFTDGADSMANAQVTLYIQNNYPSYYL